MSGATKSVSRFAMVVSGTLPLDAGNHESHGLAVAPLLLSSSGHGNKVFSTIGASNICG